MSRAVFVIGHGGRRIELALRWQATSRHDTPEDINALTDELADRLSRAVMSVLRNAPRSKESQAIKRRKSCREIVASGEAEDAGSIAFDYLNRQKTGGNGGETHGKA